MARPVPNAQTPRSRRLTVGLWWLVLYLLVLYLAFRLGGHPGAPAEGWISS